MHTPPPRTPARNPGIKLRPFFWTKLPSRPDNIWSTLTAGDVSQNALQEAQIRALEKLFAEKASAATPKQASAQKGKLCLIFSTCADHAIMPDTHAAIPTSAAFLLRAAFIARMPQGALCHALLHSCDKFSD